MGGKKRGVGHKKSSGTEEPVGDVPYLPMEVWTGILIRTPAEDLLKFKRVCKAWYELIRSQSFAESHVDHWTSRTLGRFVFNFKFFWTSGLGCGCWKSGISYLVYAMYGNITRDNGCHCRYRELLTSRQRAELGCGGSKELHVLASCDGLILMFYQVEGSAYQLLICNPLTGSYKKLAVLRTCRGGHGVHSSTVDYGWTMLRTASGWYKIFGMQMLWGWGSARRECSIFELQMGTEEQPEPRRKDLVVPLSREWYIKASTTKDGKVHWFATTEVPISLAYHEHDSDIIVLSLDILKEEFSASVSVKSRLCEPERPLFPSNGAFYHAVHRPDKSSILWVLENFDTMTWTEYGSFSRSYGFDFLYLSGEIRDNNKLFLGSYVFDLISKEFGRLSMDFSGSPGRNSVLHTDSLIGWK